MMRDRVAFMSVIETTLAIENQKQMLNHISNTQIRIPVKCHFERKLDGRPLINPVLA
jgi:hypothetical protein